MILNTSGKIFLYCCLKLTLISFAIVAMLNFLPVSGLIASAQDKPADFTINLLVCIKDETGKPAVESVNKKNVLVSFTIIGGSALIKPADRSNDCALVSKQKFTASKEYIILVSTQNDNGVRVAARQFDPALFKSENVTQPQTINISLKDGVVVYNKDGKEIFYSKALKGSGGSTENRDAENPNTANDSNNSNKSTDTNANVGNGNRQDDSGTGFSLWTLAGVFLMAVVLTFSFTRKLYLNSQTAASLKPITHPLDTEYFLEVVELNRKLIIAAIKAKGSNVNSENATPQAETKTSSGEIPKPETATFQVNNEERGFSKSQNFSAVGSVRTSFGDGSNEFRITDAQEYYIKIRNGVQTSYVELQPTGESSPEHMLGNQGIRLSEQQGGKYIAFPVKEKSNEFWVFPDPRLNFSETAFSQVFPELTRENFESGTVTPRKAARQSDGETWLIQ